MKTLHHIASFRFALLLLALLAPVSFAQGSVDTTGLPAGIEATGDTVEVRALKEWALEHLGNFPAEAERVALRALKLARELEDQKGIGQSLMILGSLASDPNQAEVHYTEAKEIFEQLGDERNLARILQNMGSVYSRRGELRQSLTAYFGALEKFKNFGDELGEVYVSMNIGFILLEQDNPEDATDYFEQAIALAEALDLHHMHANSLTGLGVAFAERGAYENAEIHLRRALAVAEEHDNRFSVAAASINLGSVLNKQGHYEDALPFLFAGERLIKELGQTAGLPPVYDELGKAYMGLGQYEEALRYADEGLRIARKTESFLRQMELHQTLSEIYEATGNLEQALAHQRHYAVARDSVFNAEKTEIIADMQTRYETEEKQQAIERLEQENKIQALQASRWRAWLFGGVAGLLLLLGFLYYRYRVKRKANRLLEDLDTAKSRFFANISHEFRTPLTVILGGLQDALNGRFGKMTETFTGELHAMQRNTNQLQQLIDEVLDLNRLESGKLELKPTPCDLVRSLRWIVQADTPLAERNDIDLTLKHDVDICPRLYDAEKLRKIVDNLLSNALKFTPKGGSVRVELRSNSPVEIAVSDTGSGIPEDQQKKVFERFAQTGDRSHHGGTGIGLALAKELTELHGGTITLESEPGKGSTFTVRLPLKEAALDDVLDSPPVPSGHPAERQGGGVSSPTENGGNGATPSNRDPAEEPDRTTILIIEDNADVRAYVRRSLEETYRVLEAADGETGLQQARAELPDLIVSDVMLPGIDGYEVAQKLKSEADTDCIPVVMLTARAGEEDQAEGYDSGAEVYITKPFSSEALRAAIARLLEERKRLRKRLQENAKQDGAEASQNGSPTLADRARTIVRENLHDENFDIDELTAALAMSRAGLYNALREESNLTPATLIRTVRLEKAYELLSSEAGTVSEVAYAVGFKSRSHFSRTFREHYGKPPLSVLSAQEE